MTDPAGNGFPSRQRGDYRDDMLVTYRYGLRSRVNPETGALFTEAAITTITAPHGLAWMRADALDTVLIQDQAAGQWIAAQLDPATASTQILDALWGVLYDLARLTASGGTGTVSAPCPAGTTFVGSGFIGDPGAVWGIVTGGPAAGQRFQVVVTDISPLDGSDATLVLFGLDTGTITNLDPGVQIQWANAPDFVTSLATVTSKFTGGNPAEGDKAYGQRLLRRIRHKAAAWNTAQIAAAIEDSTGTNVVARAFVYACAGHAGTTFATFLVNRAGGIGPLAMLPSPGDRAVVSAYVTPGLSPVAPGIAELPIVPTTGTGSDVVLELSMTAGNDSGWTDYQPWPLQVGGVAPVIIGVADSTHFTLFSPTAPPIGVTAPSMMVWTTSSSRWTALDVASVVLLSGNDYTVTLAAAATLVVGRLVSPATSRADLIAQTIELYFDGLGPGELLPPADSRMHRAFRVPKPQEEWPTRAGAGILNALEQALGGALADSDVASMSAITPPVPSDPILGPTKLVLRRCCIAAF